MANTYRTPYNPKGEFTEDQYQAFQALPSRAAALRTEMMRKTETTRREFENRFPLATRLLLARVHSKTP